MDGWVGIALALRGPQQEAMRSRLPTYLHPLAGRPLAWHVLRAISSIEPGSHRLQLIAAQPLGPAVVGGLPTEVAVLGSDDDGTTVLAAALAPDVERVLFVDAAAAALHSSLTALVQGPTGRALVADDGRPVAAWLDRQAVPLPVAASEALAASARACTPEAGAEPAEVFVVRERASLARAGSLIRGRVVDRLMAGGVTFLQPETVLVDVDIAIGPDTVIYPGVVLEGESSIGAETVIGPACRIIDSQIGSGVELKGWNYISGTMIRNRAVLEPYVRRGFD